MKRAKKGKIKDKKKQEGIREGNKKAKRMKTKKTKKKKDNPQEKRIKIIQLKNHLLEYNYFPKIKFLLFEDNN